MNHELYMRRCFDLARLGAGQVSPNPVVGAVLVHNDRIIGEGWHQRYGEAHAEVNALKSVVEKDLQLVPQSTLYVSLEPCCIHGNTPPCTDLILRHKIPRVVISCIDQTAEVKGRGVDILQRAGVKVTTGVLQEEGKRISAIRNTFTSLMRPYVLLKFARSADGFLGREGEQVWISNEYSKRYAHKLRATYDAILVGTNTALTDDPALTNRLWHGRSPVRILLDRTLRAGRDRKLLSATAHTIVVTERRIEGAVPEHLQYLTFKFDHKLLSRLLGKLAGQGLTSLIVEGGAKTIRSFVEEGFWDEAMVFTASSLLEDGIPAPVFTGEKVAEHPIHDDLLTIYRNPAPRPLNFV